MKLNISPLSQRDPRWKDQRLGMKNGTTIGSDGCVITCHSMNMTYHGKPTLPNELDDYLTDKGLYYQGNLWVPARANQVWSEYKHVKTIYCEKDPAPIHEIKSAIDRSQPPTLWLINGGVRHNVLAVGYEGDQIIVNDPWMGDTIKIENRWGDSKAVILSVDFYEGPMPNTDTMVQVPAKDFEGMVFKSTQHDKTTKTYGFEDPRTTTAEQIDEKIQKSINAYKGQVSQAQADTAQAKRELAVSAQEVKNREEQVSRLKEQLTKVQEDCEGLVKALQKRVEEAEKVASDLRAQAVRKQEEIDAVYKQKGAVVDYKKLALKERIKVCVDILFA